MRSITSLVSRLENTYANKQSQFIVDKNVLASKHRKISPLASSFPGSIEKDPIKLERRSSVVSDIDLLRDYKTR